MQNVYFIEFFFMIFSAKFPPAAVSSLITVQRSMKLYFFLFLVTLYDFQKNRIGIYMIKIITSSSCFAFALELGRTTRLVLIIQ